MKEDCKRHGDLFTEDGGRSWFCKSCGAVWEVWNFRSRMGLWRRSDARMEITR